MTIQVVPTGADAFYNQTTTLEGTPFRLAFAFNGRCSCWYLSIADASGVDIYNGVKLTCNQRLLRKCRDPRRPAGDFLVLSSTADTSPPGLTDLVSGGRCTLFYLTSDVLTAVQTPAGIASLQTQLATGTQNQTASTYGAK